GHGHPRVVHQFREPRLDGLPSRSIQVRACERVLGVHPAHGLRSIGVLEPPIRIGDLDPVVVLHDRVLAGGRIREAPVGGEAEAQGGSGDGEKGEGAQRDAHERGPPGVGATRGQGAQRAVQEPMLSRVGPGRRSGGPSRRERPPARDQKPERRLNSKNAPLPGRSSGFTQSTWSTAKPNRFTRATAPVLFTISRVPPKIAGLVMESQATPASKKAPISMGMGPYRLRLPNRPSSGARTAGLPTSLRRASIGSSPGQLPAGWAPHSDGENEPVSYPRTRSGYPTNGG